MSLNLLFSLLPMPVSMRTRPSSCSMSRQRNASGMRLRSSGGARRAQSALGTMPNMAPPSRCCRPASRAWQVNRPTLKVVERLGTVALGQFQQFRKALRGRDGVSRGAVTAFDLDPEVIAHRVEVSAWQVREQLAGEPHRTDARALQQQPRCPLDLGRHEGPIEPRVVRDEDAALERREQAIDDGVERG